jgi:hypothetical protein
MRMARLPAGFGGMAGLGLVGLSTAMDAAGQLNQDPARPGANAAGAGGSIGGGVIGGLIGAKLGGPFAPFTAPLGAWAGSQLGGGGLRNAYSAGADWLRGSPLDQEIRNTEKMHASQVRMGFNALPLDQARREMELAIQEQAAREIARLNAQQTYQHAALSAAMVPMGRYAGGSYTDPAFSAALGSVASAYGGMG